LGADQFQCIATMGHFREYDGNLKQFPFDKLATCASNDSTDFFEKDIPYREIEGKRKHIAEMRGIIAQYNVNHIYLATDDDREGEAIAWHICKVFHLPILQTKRIVFHEITAAAVCASLKSPRTVDLSIVRAQQTRQLLDIFVGFKISPTLWKAIIAAKHASLSAGRCQTPALRLVYERELERRHLLQSFQEKPCVIYHLYANFFGIEDNLQENNSLFDNAKDDDTKENDDFNSSGMFVCNRTFDDPVQVKQFLSRSLLHTHHWKVEKEVESICSGPRPFNTSRLLQTASHRLGLSPQQTMAMCQILYQNGLITYMRTESQTYASTFIESVGEYVKQRWNVAISMLPVFTENNVSAAGAHEAIRPTNIHCAHYDADNLVMAKLYSLIWTTTVESCMDRAIYQCQRVVVDSPDEGTEYHATIRHPFIPGWMVVAKEKQWTQQKHAANKIKMKMLCLNKDRIAFQEIRAICKPNLSLPPQYSESSLIQRLEKLGIGRPSTFASIIETIKDRGYVRLQDNTRRLDKDKDKEVATMHCVDFILLPTPSLPSSMSLSTPSLSLTPALTSSLSLTPSLTSSLSLTPSLSSTSSLSLTPALTSSLSLTPSLTSSLQEIAKDVPISTSIYAKNRLMLRPMGDSVMEFLLREYGELFSYNYTAEMEARLDEIVASESSSLACQVLHAYHESIQDLLASSKKSSSSSKKSNMYKLADREDCFLLFQSYGVELCIIHNNNKQENEEETKEEDNITEYISVDHEKLDMERAKAGLYTYDEIMARARGSGEVIGTLNGASILLKKGRYGPYLEWTDADNALQRTSLRKFPEWDNWEIEQIIDQILVSKDKDNGNKDSSGILPLRHDLSLRKGKYGLYLHYIPAITMDTTNVSPVKKAKRLPTKKMSKTTTTKPKPVFYSLQGYLGDTTNGVELLSWAISKYNL
jgi:DNA topoisomerase IA